MKSTSNHLNACDGIILAGTRALDYNRCLTKKDYSWQDQAILERQLEIISEAARKLDKSETDKYPHIPWRNIFSIDIKTKELSLLHKKNENFSYKQTLI